VCVRCAEPRWEDSAVEGEESRCRAGGWGRRESRDLYTGARALSLVLGSWGLGVLGGRDGNRGSSRDPGRTDSRLALQTRREAGRSGNGWLRARRGRERGLGCAQGARGGCHSGRDEAWRRITSDNDGNQKCNARPRSTRALGMEAGDGDTPRCTTEATGQSRASAVRWPGGLKNVVCCASRTPYLVPTLLLVVVVA